MADVVLGSGTFTLPMSYVYFIQAEHGGPVKIGRSESPYNRLRELQTASPHALVLRSVIEGGADLEKRLHASFAKLRMEGEWFAPHPVLVKVGRIVLEDVEPEPSHGTVELPHDAHEVVWAGKDVDHRVPGTVLRDIAKHNGSSQRRGPRVK